MKQKFLWLLGVTLIVVIVDQITKNYILKAFEYGESIGVIQNYFNITYVRNFGAAFGIFSKVSSGIRDFVFLLIPPVAMVVILFMLKTTPPGEKIKTLALCMIFAGALGNYIDRIRFGYVVDFLDFHYYEKWAWPAFNVADTSIVCGISILILIELFTPAPVKREKTG